MIYFERTINSVPCTACGYKEPGTRYIFKMGKVLDEGLELALCVPCKNSFLNPLKFGLQKGMSVQVKAKGYALTDRFTVVDFHEEMKAIRIKDEEGLEHTVLLAEVRQV